MEKIIVAVVSVIITIGAYAQTDSLNNRMNPTTPKDNAVYQDNSGIKATDQQNKTNENKQYQKAVPSNDSTAKAKSPVKSHPIRKSTKTDKEKMYLVPDSTAKKNYK